MSKFLILTIPNIPENRIIDRSIDSIIYIKLFPVLIAAKPSTRVVKKKKKPIFVNDIIEGFLLLL